MARIHRYRGQCCASWALASSVLFLQGWSAPAVSAESGELEEIVVTGIRAGLRSSLEVKRESIQVVDAISAEDIGHFPDKNLGEALQRITGVQISRQDGEGRGVSIRGAEPGLNRVEINGVTALSLTVGGGRDVDFRDLPVEFVSRLEVFKSSTPEMTEGGIGGTVRVITRRPLEHRAVPRRLHPDGLQRSGSEVRPEARHHRQSHLLEQHAGRPGCGDL